MKEEFLQYIWNHKLYKRDKFKAFTGQQIEIINPGNLNTDSGPDFFNSKISIDGTTWAGNVEIHNKSSDWKKHRHHLEKAYDNVVLHVVNEYDKEVFRTNGEVIPTAKLEFDKSIYSNYQRLLKAQKWAQCEEAISNVDKFNLNHWLMSLMIERLSDKSDNIIQDLKTNKYDWEESFYRLLARNFGFKLNALPFELLAKSLPLKTIAKHKNSLFQIEALFFGQAGMLNDKSIQDAYYQKLSDEYHFLNNKFKLQPLEKHLWKFMRSRPVNFPTVRIAQLASLVHNSTSLFSKILDIKNVNQVYGLFDTQASEYWDTHYVFGKESPKRKKKLGKSAIDIITINSIVPLLFNYGKRTDDEEYKQRALKFLEELKPEKNSIITKWSEIGISAENAFDSQALIQLRNNHCIKKKCLYCQIGHRIINRQVL